MWITLKAQLTPPIGERGLTKRNVRFRPKLDYHNSKVECQFADLAEMLDKAVNHFRLKTIYSTHPERLNANLSDYSTDTMSFLTFVCV